MDISLCALNGNHLQWAGANNPLWIIRNGELIEYNPNKQPIGKVDKPTTFTTHYIELQQGDKIYIFSDGYADQFGGEKGKKFKAANLKKLLLSIQHESMEQQKNILKQAFNQWKANLEQVDDVLVIGVSV
jgi:serine phosphatase RsbU (regulator of sigma subunit)